MTTDIDPTLWQIHGDFCTGNVEASHPAFPAARHPDILGRPRLIVTENMMVNLAAYAALFPELLKRCQARESVNADGSAMPHLGGLLKIIREPCAP